MVYRPLSRERPFSQKQKRTEYEPYDYVNGASLVVVQNTARAEDALAWKLRPGRNPPEAYVTGPD